MLEELKKLPPEAPCIATAAATTNAKIKRKPAQKKKSRNLIKVRETLCMLTVGQNTKLWLIVINFVSGT